MAENIICDLEKKNQRVKKWSETTINIKWGIWRYKTHVQLYIHIFTQINACVSRERERERERGQIINIGQGKTFFLLILGRSDIKIEFLQMPKDLHRSEIPGSYHIITEGKTWKKKILLISIKQVYIP